MAEWRAHAEATRRQLPDLCERYPLSTSLEPLTPHWQDAPRAGLTAGVDLIANGLSPPGLSHPGLSHPGLSR